MGRSLRAVTLALASALPWCSQAANIFSPGDLTAAHAGLSGLENCTKCHEAGKQLSQQRCLDCHTELVPEIASVEGFHGRIAAKDRDCWTCHHEHRGRGFALIDWGAGGQKKFDHARTGAPLNGKHAAVACEKCHDPKLIRDQELENLLAVQRNRKTFLGLPPMKECASCHFDEHRGQLGDDCQRCHTEKSWKPASGFKHSRTEFPLTGKHVKVACVKCHAKEQDPGFEAGALTGPVDPDAFFRYQPIQHASCEDCHEDPHEGRFGSSCSRCHTTEDWKKVIAAAAEDRAFHDKTRYPLRGAHQTVSCVACHGPYPGVPARFKGLRFQACTDCHADAHEGQLARRGPAATACDRCHDVNGFTPAHFGLEAHDKLAFKLEGAHRVVACKDCHPHDPELAKRFPEPIRKALAARGRPVEISLAVFSIAGKLSRCETCHADPHAGQLRRPTGCAACHDVDSFAVKRFDHDRDSRFALTGQHAKAACAACHTAEQTPAGRVVRYRPLPLTCAGCHADPHGGQFAPAEGRGGRPPATACERCHETESWKKTLFRHEPPFTTYQLTGKHRDVACKDCHPRVAAGAGVRVVRYRPLPRACEGCHADFHKGAFRGFVPLPGTAP
jgi:hypothetical protein